MKRREFIGLATGAAAWSSVAKAQQPHAIPLVGFLGANAEKSQAEWTAAFVQRLSELGWQNGRTVRLEFRWVEGRSDRSAGLAAELVKLKANVIVTHATHNVTAAMRATSDIPIVFASAGDPVANKLVNSLSQPGGNITGLSLQQADLAGKRIDLLREIVSDLSRVGFIIHPDNPNLAIELQRVTEIAKSLKIDMVVQEVNSAEAIAPALEKLRLEVQALYISQDPFFVAHLLPALSRSARIPTVHTTREQVKAGGLVSYGPSFADLFRRAADLVDKILRGAKPADLPVQQPVKFDLAINLKTTRALGLTIPPSLLARADEVIE